MASDERPLFVGVAGTIGAGKSELCKRLKALIPGAVDLQEPVDTELLDLFYSDKHRYAFEFQMYMLERRFNLHQQAIWSPVPVIQDRTLYEDTIFARMCHDAGFMSGHEFRTYMNFFRTFESYMRRPNVILYLDVRPEVALERIRKRDRPAERGMTIEYLRGLEATYRPWIEKCREILNIEVVDWNQFRATEEILPIIAARARKLDDITIHAGEHL
jgi:deoxyadenosine kinase